MYEHFYRHLIGRVPESDLRALRRAEHLPWEDISLQSVNSPEARKALNSIIRIKYHIDETRFGMD